MHDCEFQVLSAWYLALMFLLTLANSRAFSLSRPVPLHVQFFGFSSYNGLCLVCFQHAQFRREQNVIVNGDNCYRWEMSDKVRLHKL